MFPVSSKFNTRQGPEGRAVVARHPRATEAHTFLAGYALGLTSAVDM